ncbi:MAG: hypothetical protein JNK82_25280, partial [Myxococcaceae bacterium]|nr:hypothetical protein [Myxococcaceae bacterium]
ATDSVALHHQKPLAPEQHELLTMRSTLMPGVPRAFPFSFTCLAPGRSHESAYVDVPNDPRTRDDRSVIRFDLGIIQCGGQGDAIMLSDNTRLSRTGDVWSAQPTGVTANLIAATDAMAPFFGALNDESVGYDQIATFNSRLGFPRVRLQSSAQTATFTHNGARYAQTGLVGAPAYAAADTLTVTGLLLDGGVATFFDGGAAVVTVPAPVPLPAPAQLFGPRASLATPIQLPDGTFDVLYVSLGAPSQRGGEGGLFRTVPASAMALDAGIRSAPLLDAEALRALASWGLDAGTVYIAAYRQVEVDGFFTQTDGGRRPVPVQAGRMVQVAVPDLAP